MKTPQFIVITLVCLVCNTSLYGQFAAQRQAEAKELTLSQARPSMLQQSLAVQSSSNLTADLISFDSQNSFFLFYPIYNSSPGSSILYLIPRDNNTSGVSYDWDKGIRFVQDGSMQVKGKMGTLEMNGAVGNFLDDSFMHNNNTVPHYGIRWTADSWNSGSHTAYFSGCAGIKLFTNGTPRLCINGNGKVGIGTETPDEMLTVNGKIHAKEVLIDLNGPLADFVFSPDYSLMPLTQVEAFVKTNNHLPDMPSAAEVSEKGLSVGEMQNKLLQKIEELTLYVIEQQKEIDLMRKALKK